MGEDVKVKHRFLVHSLNHTFVVVDIREFGLPTEIYPPEGQSKVVPALRFQSWKDAERYFSGAGAGRETIENASAAIRKSSLAVISIV